MTAHPIQAGRREGRSRAGSRPAAPRRPWGPAALIACARMRLIGTPRGVLVLREENAAGEKGAGAD